MFRALILAALAFLPAASAAAQSIDVHSPELRHSDRLTPRQVHALIANAKTPGDHEQIARYYETKSLEYRAQAQVHAQMLAAFMAQTATNKDKTQASTISHCDYMFRSLIERARDADRRAIEQLALARAAAGAE